MKIRLEWQNNSLMTKVALAFLFVFIISNSVWAWGKTGHRLIAKVAENNVSQSTLTKVSYFLKGKTMSDVALWADKIKKSRIETATWHYVNFSKENSQIISNSSSKQVNIITEVAKMVKQLKDERLPFHARREALMFIIHLVGDLHQPMHCSPDGDRGGNDIEVSYFSKKSNLHKVWDSGLIDKIDGSEEIKLLKIKKKWALKLKKKSHELDFIQWARESNEIARLYAYRLSPNNKLGSKYWKNSIDVCSRQVWLGGIRLAHLLDTIFNNANDRCIISNYRSKSHNRKTHKKWKSEEVFSL